MDVFFIINNGQINWKSLFDMHLVIQMLQNGHLTIMLQFYMASMVMRVWFILLLVMFSVVFASIVKTYVFFEHTYKNQKSNRSIREPMVKVKKLVKKVKRYMMKEYMLRTFMESEYITEKYMDK